MSTGGSRGTSYSRRAKKPSGGTKESVPGDLDQRERRTQGWNERALIAVGGVRARVTSGVRERREVHSMTPDRSAEICFDLLLLVEVVGFCVQ